jgi:cytochrome c oxidase subunit II
MEAHVERPARQNEHLGPGQPQLDGQRGRPLTAALMQSALTPAGPAAQDIATLTWVLSIGAMLILLAIMALLVHGVVRNPGPVNTGLWVVGGGMIFPVVVLSLLWLYSSRMTDAMAGAVAPDALRIEVDAMAAYLGSLR